MKEIDEVRDYIDPMDSDIAIAFQAIVDRLIATEDVLRWYADQTNYQRPKNSCWDDDDTIVQDDYGDKARAYFTGDTDE